MKSKAKVVTRHYPSYPDPDAIKLNPPVPFRGTIQGGLAPGKIIEIHGHVPGGAYRFAVNLVIPKPGFNDRDIAMHFNPRFDERCVVYNTLRNGEWDDEQRGVNMPFLHREDFSIMILTESTEYKVAVNGRHYGEFKHRMPFHLVSELEIDADVKINRIEQRMNTVMPLGVMQPNVCPALPIGILPAGPIVPPPSGTSYQPVYNPPSNFGYPGMNIPSQPYPYAAQPGPSNHRDLLPINNPKTPFTFRLHGCLRPGLLVYISGRPHIEPDRFSINFTTGSGPDADNAFHFNPRFPEGIVVRNSTHNGDWDSTEERFGPPFPFTPGVHFDMIIQVLEDKYQVAVNGQHFIEYRHRLQPLSRINTFTIDGDIIISSVRFK